MLTWRHSFNIHTIAHNSGGKNEVQLRTLSHLPLWCRVVPCGASLVSLSQSGSQAPWCSGQARSRQSRHDSEEWASGGRGL